MDGATPTHPLRSFAGKGASPVRPAVAPQHVRTPERRRARASDLIGLPLPDHTLAQAEKFQDFVYPGSKGDRIAIDGDNPLLKVYGYLARSDGRFGSFRMCAFQRYGAVHPHPPLPLPDRRPERDKAEGRYRMRHCRKARATEVPLFYPLVASGEEIRDKGLDS